MRSLFWATEPELWQADDIPEMQTKWRSHVRPLDLICLSFNLRERAAPPCYIITGFP